MTRMTKRALLVAAGSGLAVLRLARLSHRPALAVDSVVLTDKA